MKKFTLIFIMLLAMAGFTQAQVVEDFEHIGLNYMLGGANDSSSMVTVANPDPTGINTSATVVKFIRDKDGVPWGGFWSSLPTPVDITTNKFVHVKVWKTRISPIHFKLEGGADGTLEKTSMNPQANTGMWEDIVFDFSVKTGTYPIIAFMPDFEDPLTLTEDITIYFDDIVVNNDPTPASAAAYVIEDFEYISLNLMLGDATDLSKMEIVVNPDATGANTSGNVIKYTRDKDGVPWGGFWSALADSIDVTTNKFMHVKVWKPRITPIRFKVEGGAAGNLEQISKYPQTLKSAWEDIVIDFSSKTGKYKVIAFMPDFIEPVNLASDMVMYFDNIVLNNDSMPASDTTLSLVTFGVNMTEQEQLGKFDPVTDFVDIAGNFNDWGSGSSAYHLKPDADSAVYYITVPLITGQDIEFKFRINGTWDDATCEFPSGGANRAYTVLSGPNVYMVWYDSLASGIGISDNLLAKKVSVYPVPFNNVLTVTSSVDVKTVIISSAYGQQIVRFDNLGIGRKTFDTSDITSGMYFVTFYTQNGDRVTKKLIKN